jgi:hypothetical protein
MEDSTASPRSPGFRDHEETMQVKKMVTGIELLAHVDVDVDQWWEKTLQADETENESEVNGLYAIASLLFLLPNLRTLELPTEWKDIQLLDDQAIDQGDLVLAINAITALESTPGHTQPLRKLETIFPFMAEGYEERSALQCLHPFMPLENLRNLFSVSCIAVEDHYTGLPFKWCSTLQSPLRRVELVYSCVDAEGLAALVSHTPQLEVFRYSHQTKWHGCQHDWNPGEFVEVLSRHCGQTITEFALTIDELFGDVENGVSHLRSFPKLKYFESDVRIFCGPPVESGQRLGQQAIMQEGERAWTKEDIPCIGEMLPESIVGVHINNDRPEPDETALRVLLKNVAEHRATRLRKLGEVVVRQYEGETPPSFLEKSGLRFEVFDQGASQPRPRHMMPLWKRQFEAIVSGIEFTS